MNYRLIKILIGTIMVGVGSAQATEYEKWYLPQVQPQHDEYLLYRLSYRGIFTAYAWKDIADVAIAAGSKPLDFNKRKSCRLSLKLSTEDFSLTELFYPVRFYWRTTVSPNLNHVYMVEATDEGKKQRHELAWLDLQNHHIEVYRKRIKVPEKVLTYDEEDEGEEPVMVWEPDGKKAPPDFINKQPLIDGKLNYLVHDKTVAVDTTRPIFDPLALVFTTRWNDFTNQPKLDFSVPFEDASRSYHARLVGKEPLEIGSQSIDTLGIEVRRNKKEDEKNEGFMLMWLSDDDRRIPLQFLVEAPFGKLKLMINETSLNNYRSPGSCVSNASIRSLPATHTRHTDGTGNKQNP